MPKIFKATVYFIDHQEEHFNNGNSILEHPCLRFDKIEVYPKAFNWQESEEFKWDDNLDINSRKAKQSDYEKYFNKRDIFGLLPSDYDERGMPKDIDQWDVIER